RRGGIRRASRASQARWFIGRGCGTAGGGACFALRLCAFHPQFTMALPSARSVCIGVDADRTDWIAAPLHFVNGLGPERHRRRISLVGCSVVVMALVEQGDRQNNVLIIAGGTLLARM